MGKMLHTQLASPKLGKRSERHVCWMPPILLPAHTLVELFMLSIFINIITNYIIIIINNYILY